MLVATARIIRFLIYAKITKWRTFSEMFFFAFWKMFHIFFSKRENWTSDWRTCCACVSEERSTPLRSLVYKRSKEFSWDFNREFKSLNYGWNRETTKLDQRSEVWRWFRTGRESLLGTFSDDDGRLPTTDFNCNTNFTVQYQLPFYLKSFSFYIEVSIIDPKMVYIFFIFIPVYMGLANPGYGRSHNFRLHSPI